MRTTLTILLLASAVAAAPAPVPRPRPLSIAGPWKLTWAGGVWTATFGQDGSYTCLSPHAAYEGSWRVDGNVLTVSEWSRGGRTMPSAAYVWRVRLTRDGARLTGHGIPPGPTVSIVLERR